MSVILQGSLDAFPPDELLPFLASHGHTGTLEVTVESVTTTVAFERGAVVFARSRSTSDPSAAIGGLFVASKASFVFHDSLQIPAGAERAEVDLSAAIENGLRRADEYREYRRHYENDSIALRVAERPEVAGPIPLTPDEIMLLVKIGSGRTIVQLCSDLQKSPVQIFPRLQRLEDAGLLVRLAPEEAAQLAHGDARLGPTRPEVEVATVEREKPAVPATQKRSSVEARLELEKPAQDEAPTMIQAPRVTKAGTVAVPPPAPPAAAADAAPETPPAAPLIAAPEPQAAAVEPESELLGTLTLSSGAMFPIVDASSTIGRTADKNTIQLNDPSVSSLHAKITRAADAFTIEDCLSRNGTFVNSDKLEPNSPRPLRNGDMIRFGKIVATFSIAKPVSIRSGTYSQDSPR